MGESLKEEIINLISEKKLMPADESLSENITDVFRVGPRKGDIQNVVVKFKSKSIKRRIYKNCKTLNSNSRIRILPYLTRIRRNTLQECENLVDDMLRNNNDWDKVKYIFADVEGNLTFIALRSFEWTFLKISADFEQLICWLKHWLTCFK